MLDHQSLCNLTEQLDLSHQIQDLKQRITDTPKPTQSNSFADMVKKGANKFIQPINVSSIAIYPNDKMKTSDETKSLVQKIIRPEEMKLQVRGLRKTKNGGVIISTESKGDIEKLRQSTQLSSSGLSVDEPKKRNPRVVIIGVPSTMPDNEALTCLYHQNLAEKLENCSLDSFLSTTKMSHKSGRRDAATCNYVIEVTAATRKALMSQERVFINWSSCPVRDFTLVTRCYKCQQYGHAAKSCRQTSFTCSHCGEQGHTIKDCTKKSDEPKCATCLHYKKPANHTTVCNQFARSVVAMLGAVAPDSFDTLHSYANTFQMPFVTPWFPEKVIPPSSGLNDYAVSLRPDYHRAVIATITHYGWKNVIYIYDSHDGLLRLQQLYQSLQPGNATFRITNVKRVSNASDVVEFLRAIEKLDRWSNKYVVLDSTTQLAKAALIMHVRDVHLGRRNYHYFLSGLVMDDRWEKEVTEYGAINITGFRLLDFSRKVVRDFIDAWKRETISAQAALTYDAVQVLIDAILRLVRKKPEFVRATMRRASQNNTNKSMDCNPKNKFIPFEHGEKISRMIRKTEIVGITGNIRFNDLGHRKNFTLQVMELTEDGDMVKVATWSDNKGLVPVIPKKVPPAITGTYDRNKTYIVTTIEEPPYIIRNDPEDPEYNPEEPFTGFCAELTKMLSEKMEINYEIKVVRDGKYGSENPKAPSGWDGMVGELLRKEADIAIAPLTVTLDREAVIDYSRPFLSFDLKPTKNTANSTSAIFSFLQPLSMEIWISILCSLFAVSVVLFIVSRFSPYEWRVVSFTDSHSDHSDVSTTKDTIDVPKVVPTTESPEKVTDEHGWLAFIMDRPTAAPDDKPCEMVVTLTHSGYKDFAVGIPKGSQLRDGVNMALQSLKEEGEIPRLVRKWFTKSECDHSDNDKGSELTLSQVAGLFYVLVGGLSLAMGVALIEFCRHGRSEAARANVPLRDALRAKAHLGNTERKGQSQRGPQRDNDRLGWNGGAFGSQYYSPANQIGQEETALHSSFTQV
ncbi:unnamed protein product [Spodoptera exigua]|nr:unnamed protein product [Spodoptera exigua]